MYYSRTRYFNVIKILIFINVAVFLIQNIAAQSNFIPFSIETNFALNYYSIVAEYKIWQIFTYMFLHANIWHLAFNMLALFFIGTGVEREWGSKPFLQYYLACGIGAGFLIFIVDASTAFINPTAISFTLGASGAIFGIILAFSILFRDREITLLLFFILPITIKGRNLLVITLVLSVFLPFLFGGGERISNSGHIGGVLSGLFFILLFRKHPYFIDAYYSLTQWWRTILGSFRSFKHSRNQREFFNSTRFYGQNQKKNSPETDLDETKMSDSEIEEKIDQLLDVISEQGIKGLSEKEKKFLERVSFLYRHKFPQ